MLVIDVPANLLKAGRANLAHKQLYSSIAYFERQSQLGPLIYRCQLRTLSAKLRQIAFESQSINKEDACFTANKIGSRQYSDKSNLLLILKPSQCHSSSEDFHPLQKAVRNKTCTEMEELTPFNHQFVPKMF